MKIKQKIVESNLEIYNFNDRRLLSFDNICNKLGYNVFTQRLNKSQIYKKSINALECTSIYEKGLDFQSRLFTAQLKQLIIKNVEDGSRLNKKSINKLLVQPRRNLTLEECSIALNRFKKGAKMVKLLVTICMRLRSYAFASSNIGPSIENDNINDEIKIAATSAQDFNVILYTRTRELNVSKKLIDILLKKPADRTESDIFAIHSVLIDLQSYRKYKKDMQKMFCKVVRYERIGRRRVILRKGHIGYNLYFVYSGIVSVLMDKDNDSVFVKQNVVSLKRGACFGEIALIENTRRTATVICSHDTELFVIDKEDFHENHLDIKWQEEFDFRFNFFKKWEPLKEWSENKIRSLTYVSRIQEYQYNQAIVENNKDNEWIWFVVKGSCDVLTTLDICENDAQPMNPSYENSIMVYQKKILKDNKKDKHECNVKPIRTDLMGKIKNKNQKEDRKACTLFVKIKTLRDGECFGLENMQNGRNSKFNVSLVSRGCEVILIVRRTFYEMCSINLEKSIWNEIKLNLKVRLYNFPPLIMNPSVYLSIMGLSMG
ncbi:hypothetical protein A3Q56_05669 [Intoshia linei]|uniref:Cyclic nucleotide-binding domain-containing protein 2 n=1 Tax=Intoshia linei TaxID=1819745 RepID=A0A177AYX8_9BILA|nr:hypothetical protein A3Q56_05669 [Intoshia linei]